MCFVFLLQGNKHRKPTSGRYFLEFLFPLNALCLKHSDLKALFQALSKKYTLHNNYITCFFMFLPSTPSKTSLCSSVSKKVDTNTKRFSKRPARIKIVDVDGYVLVKANEAHNLERKVSPAEVPTAGAVNRYDLKGASRRQKLGRKGLGSTSGLSGPFSRKWTLIFFSFFHSSKQIREKTCVQYLSFFGLSLSVSACLGGLALDFLDFLKVAITL